MRVLKKRMLLIPVVLAAMNSFVFATEVDLQPPPNSKKDLGRSEQVIAYPLVQSSLKKVNGTVTADVINRMEGHLERSLYLLPKGVSSQDAYIYFVGKLELADVEPLYRCERFSCGDSSFWANNMFDIPKLYGLDRDQAYFLGKGAVVDGQQDYFAIYTVKRGNRREYALVDQFTITKSKNERSTVSSDPENSALPEQGKDWLLEWPGEKDLRQSVVFSDLVKTINQSGGPFLLTLYSPSIRSLNQFDNTMAKLDALGDELALALADNGIDSSRYRLQNAVGHGTSLRLRIDPILPDTSSR